MAKVLIMGVDTVSDAELKKVIADFLEMGHMENIVAMFRRNPQYYGWTGEILQDDRFNVRLGLTIVFEELQALGAAEIDRALPSLASLLNDDSALIRGEAIGILGIIGTREAKELITTMADDASPQVREMVELAQNND
ncbi:MAG: HEAT repeat domain-containing protein [Desulfopila sp.]